jgi:glycerophosphoryl diester phosphodiesterase
MNRIMTAATVALMLTSAAAPAETTRATDADAPFVSAHRGGAAYAPENTMVAFRNAVRLGVDELEADAQLTADGVPVIIHDDTLDRTTDCTGAVSDTVLADVRTCDAAYHFSPGQPTTSPDDDLPHPLRGAGVQVPTADELLAYVAALGPDGPTLSIEIKDIPGEANFDPAGTEIAEVLVPMIRAHGVTDRVVVQSFWPPAIDAVKRLAPEVRTQFLTTSSMGQTAVQNVAYVTARGHDVAAPNHDAPDLTREVVSSAQATGSQVVPWTPDAVADLTAAVALGVDGIITNHPACLLDLLGRAAPAKVTPPGVPGRGARCSDDPANPPPASRARPASVR